MEVSCQIAEVAEDWWGDSWQKVVLGIAFHMTNDPSTKRLPPTLILTDIQWLDGPHLSFCSLNDGNPPASWNKWNPVNHILDVRGCCNDDPCLARLMQLITVTLECIVYMNIICIL